VSEASNPEGPSIADLSEHDQLLHGIGRVAQAQVQVEVVLRQLFVSLTLPSPAMHLVAKKSGVDPLAQDCRVLLANSGLPAEVTAAGDLALVAAIEADKHRHRVVHDWWLPFLDPADPGGRPFKRLRADKQSAFAYVSESSGIDFVDDAEAQLRRALVRLHALQFAITYGRAPEAPPIGPTLDELLPEIRGEITLLPGGGHRVNAPPHEA
jgi:hypothetical protein